MSEIKKESHFIEGLIFGGLLGAGLGLLFAPSAGDKIRDKVREKLKDLELDEIVDRFIEAFDEGKEEAGRVSQELEKGTCE
ncbi:MAG: YtxH domain-containing protein [bacterium]|nr:YtxH domain-containing protein [Candidatus Margulisiibacteriota bacterium]